MLMVLTNWNVPLWCCCCGVNGDMMMTCVCSCYGLNVTLRGVDAMAEYDMTIVVMRRCRCCCRC
jgi:hypothetical protein